MSFRKCRVGVFFPCYEIEDCKEEIASNVEDGFDTFIYLDLLGNCVNCEVFACNSL